MKLRLISWLWEYYILYMVLHNFIAVCLAQCIVWISIGNVVSFFGTKKMKNVSGPSKVLPQITSQRLEKKCHHSQVESLTKNVCWVNELPGQRGFLSLLTFLGFQWVMEIAGSSVAPLPPGWGSRRFFALPGHGGVLVRGLSQRRSTEIPWSCWQSLLGFQSYF